ncbi:MAG: hypothetical protein AAGG08_07300 [Actinomycetota bacterium]
MRRVGGTSGTIVVGACGLLLVGCGTATEVEIATGAMASDIAAVAGGGESWVTTTTTTSTTTTTTTTLPPPTARQLDVAPFGEQRILDDLRTRARLDPPTCTPLTDGETIVDLDMNWTLGESITLTEIVDNGFGRPFETTVQLDVIADDGTYTEFALTDDVSQLLDMGLPADADEVRPLFEQLAELPLRYELDRFGVIVGATNAEAIMEALEAALLAVAEAFPEERSEVDSFLESVGIEEVEMFALDAAYTIHAFDGFLFEVGEVDVIPDVALNAFGGPNFDAESSFGIVEAVDDDGCVLVELRYGPDEDDVAETLRKMAADGELDDRPEFGGVPPTDDEVTELIEASTFLNVFQGRFDPGTNRMQRVAFSQFTPIGGDQPVFSDMYVFPAGG